MKKTILSTQAIWPLLYQSARWHIHYYLRKKSFPLASGIFLTNICNLKCRMCSIWTDGEKKTLTLGQVKSFVDAFTPGLCYLSFSGGEPLLVDKLLDMIAYAAERIAYVHLVTNGLLLDGPVVTELAKAGLSEISISLDGDREWHNFVRGNPKSFDGALNAIETVKRYAPAMKIVVNSVLFPEAPHQVEKALGLTCRLGVQHKVQPVNTHFHFDGARSKPAGIRFEALDPKRMQALLRRLANQPHLVNSRAYIKQIPDYFERRLKCPLIRPRCLLPHFFVEANAYGKLSPCMVATGWQGGMLSIDNDLRRKAKANAYIEEKKRLEKCRLCDRSMYICYWEPMISFPITNFVKFSLASLRP